MANAISIQKSISIGGKTVAEQQNLTCTVGVPIEVSVPAAQAGTLTTRTSNTVGTITMGSGGHTVTTGARIDIYWTEGGVAGVRYGVLVGTVVTTAVPITVGAGNNLPSAAVAVVVSLPVAADVKFIGSNLITYAGYSDAVGQIAFEDVTPTNVAYFNLPVAATTFDWNTNNGLTNAFAGDSPTKAYFSHNDTTGAKTMRFVAGYN